MWSVACILPEMRSSVPLFPGRDEVDQMGCIVECLGMPPEELLSTSSKVTRYFDSKRRLYQGKQKGEREPPPSTPNGPPLSNKVPASKSIAQLFRSRHSDDEEQLASLLLECLRYMPSQRLTPKQALMNPWLQQM